MNAIAQFNQLGGKTVSRQSLILLKELAYLEGSFEIIIRIDSVLNSHPEAESFYLEVEKPVIEIGLGAAQHSGLYREALDECGRLQKGYKFENGFVVKVQTGEVDKKKFKKATVPAVEKPKKTASNYGKKRPFTKSAKVDSVEEKTTRTPKKPTNYGKKRDFESKKVKYPFSKEDIPFETAKRAHDGTSFSPEKRAVSQQNDYYNHMVEVYDYNYKKALKLNKLDEFDSKFERYKNGYLKRNLAYLYSRSGLMSTMITGGSNFPVRRMEKKNIAINNKLNELVDYQKYSDFFKPESTIIKTGSDTALDQLKEKLRKEEEAHKMTLSFNKIMRKKISNEEKEKELLKVGFTEKTINAVRKDGFFELGSYVSSNRSARMRELQRRIKIEENLNQKAEVSAENPTEITFKGGSIENDYTDNRIKIFFDSIPDVEIRSFLKKAGQAFKWSPKNKAWQRQLNTYYSGSRNDLYKFLGVNEPEPTKKKVVETKSPQIEKAVTTTKKSSVETINLSDITLDTKRFQNRNKLEENVVQNIVDNFDPTQFDPLILWQDKGKNYLLAGHHRYEALKRLGKKTAEVKFKKATEKEAIYFAKVESNANRTLETPIERAKIYREMRNELSKKAIEEKAKAIEGKNASTILNLSFLNPSGIVIDSLQKIAVGDEQNKSTLGTVADWIGDARRTYTDLTNSHEKEMFDFLMDKEASKRVTTKAEFKQKIYALVGTLDFDATKPLNLKRFKYVTEGEKVYQEESDELNRQIRELTEQKLNLLSRLSDPTRPDFIQKNDQAGNNAAAKKLDEYNTRITKIQKDVIELSRNKGKYTAASNQAALFGTVPEVVSFATPEIKQEPILYVPTVVPAQEKILVSQATKEAQKPVNSKYKTAIDREIENAQPVELFKIKGDLAKFLGKIEIKPVQSLAITLDSGEGGGKTHTIYQWANDFYEAGYKPIIWSLEEHANSSLSINKAEKYFGENKAFIPIESERENEAKADTLKRISDSVKDFDVIFIDSWTKVMELDKTLNFDQDLRKKFNGKLFVVILQRTSSGDIRGGAKVGFDGDVILKFFIDRDDFRNNYIYNHKNRYNDYMPISELKYSPYFGKLLDIPSEENEEEVLFSEEVEKI